MRKRGWGVVRSLALGGVGVVLVIVGTAVGIGEEIEKGETVTPAAQETEVLTGVGRSRLNPVPDGSALTYDDQRVTVLGSQRLTQIGTGWLADTPKEGNIYLIVKLKVDFLGDASRTHRLYEFDFDVVGDSAYVYEYEWFVDTDTPLKSGEFYGGASTSGDLVYEIDQTETNMVMIWHVGFVTDRYLSIP